ncbi:hypothetical protein DSL72_003663 [Monilinia vaccinii-corymbosi]|uniref:Uncharacterized protein n=1 Tax=Monilinia vaccinii-corymbosi TaxID=61207 RepID=A0A8A3NXE7_9HELO|nr:hypothetical protein DSL72_003663 [Monilinia vaccinii-corymbosi]
MHMPCKIVSNVSVTQQILRSSTKGKKDCWKGLINAIVEKAPNILLEVDSNGQSPCPYFKEQEEQYNNQKRFKEDQDQECKEKHKHKQQQQQQQQQTPLEIENAKKRKGGGVDTASLNPAQIDKNPGICRPAPRRSKSKNQMTKKIKALWKSLEKKRLESGSFSDA